MEDGNISSIEVGYKIKNGKRTDEITNQFTAIQTILAKQTSTIFLPDVQMATSLSILFRQTLFVQWVFCQFTNPIFPGGKRR